MKHEEAYLNPYDNVSWAREATRVVASLLSDVVERGLDAQRMRLWVIDAGMALRKAISQTFGQCALIQLEMADGTPNSCGR